MAHEQYDESTTLQRPELQPADATLRHPTLTILHHPLMDRVGDVALMPAGDLEWPLSRNTPSFHPPDAVAGTPINDLFVTRTAIVVRRGNGDAISVEIPASPEGRSVVEVDGRPATAGTVRLSGAQLERGVLLTLGGRVVLLLHLATPLPRPSEEMGLVGASDAILRVRQILRQVARHDLAILIRGETGTGKDLIAAAIHAGSERRGAQFVAVNLGAIPAPLMSSELFGFKEGTFTGAKFTSKGHLARASGGTLFLNEIGSMPFESQATLLQFLDTKVVASLGGAQVAVNARVISATDADLERLVDEGAFSMALLQRLQAYVIHVPPLRHRRDDLGRLIVYFLKRFLPAHEHQKVIARGPKDHPWLDAGIVARLAMYDWPGNVRELASAVEGLVATSQGRDEAVLPQYLDVKLASVAPAPQPAATPAIAVQSAPAAQPPAAAERIRPSRLSSERISEAMARNDDNLTQAAKDLRISRNSLYKKLGGALSPRRGKRRPIDSGG
jgi:two-component system nitrogen regulation response regulator GlnG